MFGTLSPLVRWIAGVVFVLLVLVAVYAKGWLDRDKDFSKYKTEVKAAAMAQEEKAKQIEARNQRLNEETKNAYNTKLAALRAYYSMRVTKGIGTLPVIPTTPEGIIGYSADNLPPVATLAAQCSETTLTLYSLQNWVKDVYNNQ